MATYKPEWRKFSSFDLASALKNMGVQKLLEWTVSPPALIPSDFFHERMKRLQKFDLIGSAQAKSLLIDAVFEEIAVRYDKIKIWKNAPLQTDVLNGTADYLIARDWTYLSLPLLCVAEAKKDDFEQGLAQCLVEMQACRWKNAQEKYDFDVYGVVTSGEGWKFYKYNRDGQVFETALFSLKDIGTTLGMVDYIFAQCAISLDI